MPYHLQNAAAAQVLAGKMSGKWLKSLTRPWCCLQMVSFEDPIEALKWLEEQAFVPDIVFLGKLAVHSLPRLLRMPFPSRIIADVCSSKVFSVAYLRSVQ